MPRSLRLYIAGLVGVSTLLLIVTSLVFPLDPTIALNAGQLPPEPALLLGVAFWIAVTLFASAMPVHMPRGMLVSVSIAPILAAVYLGGPAAGAWVALLGSTEIRELRGRIPWYGTLFNHA